MEESRSVLYDLAAESELRFVLTTTFSNVSLKLVSGFAEIFGSELVQDETYTFVAPASVAVFTWQGCAIRFYGTAKKIFVTKHSMMIVPAYMHACLEDKRIKATLENTRGPISLVIGPTDAGKSSFCRILLNYAARLGRRPLYIDMDVDQNSSSFPGAISILPVEKSCDVTEGFSHKARSVYSFGYTNPNDNVPLYLILVKELGKMLQARFENVNQNTRSSGVIIDTHGWEGGPYYIATNEIAVSTFEVDVVFVISNTDLYHWLKKSVPRTVEVVYVPRQSGAVWRSKRFRSKNRDCRIWDYFYGLKTYLTPCTFDVKFTEIEIYKISPVSFVDDPKDISFSNVKVVKVPFGEDLVYYVLSLSYADATDVEKLITTNVVGFVCIVNVNMQKKCITLLSPQPYPLPSKVLIMGNVKLK